MREYGVGVGDLGEVPGRHGISGHSSSGDDGRGKGRECNAGILSGFIRAERDASPESSRHGIEVSDGARVKHGARQLHRPCSRGAHGMREYGVGVGNLGEVPGRHGISRHLSCGDDGRGKGRDCNAGILSGCIRAERDVSPESSRHGIELSDGARVEHGACELHSERSGGPHGMRVDRVGVGDFGQISVGTGKTWYQKSDDVDRRAEWKPDTSMVDRCR